ncbi:MAG: 30S ribosomal protein S6 [Candidatus Saccharimonadales bacterium]
MSARATQAGAVQGADEEHNEAVQDGTANQHRNQQRRNVPASTSGVSGSAAEQASAVRSSLNGYEIAVLYHPDLEIDLEKAENRVAKIITDNGGKITKTDNWGKRKLAYPIKKQDFAVYVFYTAEMPADNITRVEQTFNITDEIVRFLITRPDLKAMAKAETMRAEKAKKAAEHGERDDEEDNEETERPRRRSRIEE